MSELHQETLVGPRWTGEPDLALLASWMTDQGLGQGCVTHAVPLSGGTQNMLLRFAFGGADFVFRGPPSHVRANSNETMRREARVLGALAGTAVPHPRLIAGCGDETVLGAAFYLMEPVDGFNARETMIAPHRDDPAMRRGMGLAFVEGAAALAHVDHRSAGLADFGKGEGFLERQTARWLGQLESYGGFAGWPGAGGIPGIEAVARWLDDNRPAEYRLGILHGDYHFANVLFRKDAATMAAIIDWELATIGDPMLDLGQLLLCWPGRSQDHPAFMSVAPWDGFPARAEIVRRYADLTGRDDALADWYEVLACFRLGIILEGTYARACAGLAPRETGDTLHGMTLQLFARARAAAGV